MQEEGTLTRILTPENYKAMTPSANSLNEALSYLKDLYGTRERTFTAYYLESYSETAPST